MRNIVIPTAREYTVWIGKDILAEAGGQIASVAGGENAMLVTDDAVGALYGETVECSLRMAGYQTTRFTFPHGEQSKTAETYLSLLSAMAKARLTGADVVVALGGGVVGDLAGFAAATYLRGIHFAVIPTTLLAMVDSSVGGKTAVNLPEGKNLAGAFWQPLVVLSDVATLTTLPDGAFQDGVAEMIKHGVIASPALFALLREPATLSSQLPEVIEVNVGIKRDLVTRDEQDIGIRRHLTFGHTLGHAIEELSGYTVSHGKAVAAGMILVAKAAAHMRFCSEDTAHEIRELLALYGLELPVEFSAEELAEAVVFDKKRRGQRIPLILPLKIGKCARIEFSKSEFIKFVKSAL